MTVRRWFQVDSEIISCLRLYNGTTNQLTLWKRPSCNFFAVRNPIYICSASLCTSRCSFFNYYFRANTALAQLACLLCCSTPCNPDVNKDICGYYILWWTNSRILHFNAETRQLVACSCHFGVWNQLGNFNSISFNQSYSDNSQWLVDQPACIHQNEKSMNYLVCFGLHGENSLAKTLCAKRSLLLISKFRPVIRVFLNWEIFHSLPLQCRARCYAWKCFRLRRNKKMVLFRLFYAVWNATLTLQFSWDPIYTTEAR